MATQDSRFRRFLRRFSSGKTKKSFRAYAGAKLGRMLEDWITGSTSADAEIKTSLKKLRDRSRQLARDNDFVRNAVRTITNNVVGQGVKLQSQVKRRTGRGAGQMDDRVNEAIETAWVNWCRADSCHTGGTLSFTDIERIIIGDQVQSGEIFVRLVKRPFGRSRIPLALELIESDLLDTDFNGKHTNGNQIRMGVERDDWGRPVAYHMKEVHPGDTAYGGISTQETGRYRRIPAEEILHIYKAERVGQTRGVPWIASAISRLHQLQGYEEAEVVAARASAALMGFIESPEGELQGDDVFDGDRVSDFEPGVFKYLAPGEKVNIPQLNRPGGQFDPFMRAMLRGAAAGMGISYESLSRDYSQSNYSSSRLALLDDRDNWRAIQKWMIESFHQKVFEAWLEMAVLSNVLNLPGYETVPEAYQRVRWMPRGWSWVDPAKEVAAYKDAVRSGFMTQADVLASSGVDLEELMAQRRRELDMADRLNLAFEIDPSQFSAGGQAQIQLPLEVGDGDVPPSEDELPSSKD